MKEILEDFLLINLFVAPALYWDAIRGKTKKKHYWKWVAVAEASALGATYVVNR